MLIVRGSANLEFTLYIISQLYAQKVVVDENTNHYTGTQANAPDPNRNPGPHEAQRDREARLFGGLMRPLSHTSDNRESRALLSFCWAFFLDHIIVFFLFRQGPQECLGKSRTLPHHAFGRLFHDFEYLDCVFPIGIFGVMDVEVANDSPYVMLRNFITIHNYQ